MTNKYDFSKLDDICKTKIEVDGKYTELVQQHRLDLDCQENERKFLRITRCNQKWLTLSLQEKTSTSKRYIYLNAESAQEIVEYLSAWLEVKNNDENH